MTNAPRKEAQPAASQAYRAAVTGRYVTKANHKRAAEIYAKAVESQGNKAPSWIKRIAD